MKRMVAAMLVAGTLVLGGHDAPAKLIELPLVVNGSFEDGPDLGGEAYRAVNSGSRELRGWEVTRGQIDYIGPHWQHSHGQRSLDLHGSPGIGGIKQMLPTRKGRKYRLTFALAGNPNAQVGPLQYTVAVQAAGEKAEFSFNAAGRTEKDMGWQTHVWDFVAQADETTLEIYSPMTQAPFAGPALDDVKVAQVR
jgi:choice-of-anchor C domain-containing protein